MTDDATPDNADAPASPLWAKVGTVVVALLLVGLIALLATRDDDDSASAASPLIGRFVPELEATTLDGATFDIDATRGRWVLLNFFASWCIPCENEHPELVEFSERHSDGSAMVVSVVMGDTAENARAFFQARGGDWPVMVDAETAPARFVVLQVPESFLVSPAGVVVAKWNGEITADVVDAAIAELEALAQ